MSASAAPQSNHSWSRARPPLGLRIAAIAAGVILAMPVAAVATAGTGALHAPAQADPGSTIMVTGDWVAAGQTDNLTYDGALVTSFLALTSGRFAVQFTIPDSAEPGSTGRISARDNAGNLLATTTLSISSTTAATLSVPAEVAPGSTIAVSGAGFAASQQGYLTINGLAITTFAASPDGFFSVPLTVPGTTRLGVDRLSARDGADQLIVQRLLAARW